MTMLALLVSSAASATLMAAFLGYDSVNAHRQMENRLAMLADIAGQNSAAALLFDDQAAAVEVLGALDADRSVVSACLYGQTGGLFAEYQRRAGVHACAAEFHPGVAAAGFVTLSRTVERGGDFAGTLYLTSDLHEIQERWQRMLAIAGLLLVMALVVGGIAGSLLQRQISRPVRELAAAMHAVTERHNFGARVALAGADEIVELGSGFNTMLAELEKRAAEKTAFEAQLQHQALNDDLTALPNRRLLADRLSHALNVARRAHHEVALLYVDLDGFKLVNDSLGHAVGDLLLRQVGERLRSRVRAADTLARLGGDEFAVVLSGATARQEAGVVAAALLDVLTPLFLVEEHEITIGASIGVSVYPENGATPVQLLQQADSAMYAAKRLGKNRTVLFSDELGAAIRERLKLETQLRVAIVHGQIHVHYQPEFDVASGRLVRFEALARWVHPALGSIAPGKFIPVAEETGLIVPLGIYVMDLACREAVRWQTQGGQGVQVAVNVSTLQLMRDSFVDEVGDVLQATGLDPHLLQIELTESVTLNGAARVTEALHELSALGVNLAIDDFGTGYSCLSYLPKLPFDALKIDRSFVKDLGERREVGAMVHSLVTLAHNLGMRVIAEGVETEEQLALIAEAGCNEVQGYLMGRPSPEPEAFLGKRARASRAETEAGGRNLETGSGFGVGAEARGQEGMDEELISASADGSAEERAEERNPPVILR
jgi:diguanylate cyclase (GGDEF)-like protein